ncbi:hypothetical protein KKF34_12810 [Myxococcota bacterium]|nr:hypothetical protein [Myxococcota bacterium]
MSLKLFFLLPFLFITCSKESEVDIISKERATNEDLLVSNPEVIVYSGKNSISEKDGVPFIDNQLLVMFKNDTDENEKNRIINSIGGSIVGKIPSINLYQILLPKSSFSALNSKIIDLLKYPSVEAAKLNTNMDTPERASKKIIRSKNQSKKY